MGQFTHEGKTQITSERSHLFLLSNSKWGLNFNIINIIKFWREQTIFKWSRDKSNLVLLWVGGAVYKEINRTIKRRKSYPTLSFTKLWKSWWLSETCCGMTKANSATAWSPEIEVRDTAAQHVVLRIPTHTVTTQETSEDSSFPWMWCSRDSVGGGQDCLIYAQVTKHTSISTDCVGKQVGKKGSTRQLWLALPTHIGCFWWMNRSPRQLGIKCWVRIIPPKAAAERVLFVNTTVVLYTPQYAKEIYQRQHLRLDPRNGCHFGPESSLAIP